MNAQRLARDVAVAVLVTLAAAAIVARVPALRRLIDPGACGCR